MGKGDGGQLTRSLGLRHVFALSTGAMLSSGLFLLPGLAAAKAGPAAVLAYLLAGCLAVPAMLSVSELATALPKAGGAYYFLERALGPAVGTVAGLGTWLSLVLKDAFAMVGMSAYLVLILDVDSTTLALVLISLFTLVNVVGSKASASMQLGLVVLVLSVMAWFVVQGLWETVDRGVDGSNLDPFFTHGGSGLVAVIGLVFVSYGGLTKVASAAEEVEDPSQRIPQGMALSLVTATALYTLGVLVTVAVVPAEVLHGDLAPIHTAAEAVMPKVGAWLVVVAALAAFASAVNAGILAAARYPMAMARDGLLPAWMGGLGRFGTPVFGVVSTGVAIALVVLVFDAEAIAKLASAFVLLTLGLVNLAVLVLRASEIKSYAPSFWSPLYPWTQLVGIGISGYLISRLGSAALVFVGVVTAVGWAWHHLYATPRTERAGAIRHVFRRWGREADDSLEREISAAMALATVSGTGTTTPALSPEPWCYPSPREPASVRRPPVLRRCCRSGSGCPPSGSPKGSWRPDPCGFSRLRTIRRLHQWPCLRFWTLTSWSSSERRRASAFRRRGAVRGSGSTLCSSSLGRPPSQDGHSAWPESWRGSCTPGHGCAGRRPLRTR
ncbi:MAG: hypothetical protein CM1200mP26_07020 [Acidimicrobiales bacterium]|nr:MAG: hypothetical protein CM1200mP26_07020 [Acidimicrobiales bacterium]